MRSKIGICCRLCARMKVRKSDCKKCSGVTKIARALVPNMVGDFYNLLHGYEIIASKIVKIDKSSHV